MCQTQIDDSPTHEWLAMICFPDGLHRIVMISPLRRVALLPVVLPVVLVANSTVPIARTNVHTTEFICPVRPPWLNPTQNHTAKRPWIIYPLHLRIYPVLKWRYGVVSNAPPVKSHISLVNYVTPMSTSKMSFDNSPVVSKNVGHGMRF